MIDILDTYFYSVSGGDAAYLSLNHEFIYDGSKNVIGNENEDVTLTTLNTFSLEDFEIQVKHSFDGDIRNISINVPMKLWNKCLKEKAEKL